MRCGEGVRRRLVADELLESRRLKIRGVLYSNHSSFGCNEGPHHPVLDVIDFLVFFCGMLYETKHVHCASLHHLLRVSQFKNENYIDVLFFLAHSHYHQNIMILQSAKKVLDSSQQTLH